MKVLFFAPHAGILEHARAERDLAHCFRSTGWDVVLVSCHGCLNSYCNVMSASGFAPSDANQVAPQICKGCRSASSRLLGESQDLNHLTMDDFLDSTDNSAIDVTLSHVTPSNWESVNVEGIPVGRLAAYEFMLSYKLHSRTIPTALWPSYLRMLRSVLVSAVTCPRILDAESPDRVIVYNSLYGVNGVWKRSAEARGIATFALQYNILAPRIHESLMIYRDDGARCSINHSDDAQAALSRPLTSGQVDAVTAALLSNIRASNLFVYSRPHQGTPPRVTRERLGLDAERPVVFVPLSSEDERFAAALVDVEIMAREPHTFPTQTHFLRYLARLAEHRSDLQFVIRVHPRMFPNRREGALAPAARELLQVLEEVPENVRVNTPDQALSLMDVAQVTTVCLAGRSSVGAQLSAFGIPIVVHDPEILTAFPPSLGRVVAGPSDLEPAIDAAVGSPWDLDSIIRAYRWLAFSTASMSVDLASTSKVSSTGQRRVPQLRALALNLLRRTKRHLPLRARAMLKSRIIRRGASRMIRPDSAALSRYEPLVRVVEDELESVAQTQVLLSGDPATERTAVLASLDSLVDVLGEFEDPLSLSSRLRQRLSSLASQR